MSETVHYYYTTLTSAGPLSIMPTGAPGFQVYLAKENLGTYTKLEEAFTAAVTGQTSKPHGVEDWNALEVPGDLNEWQAKVFATVSRLRPA